MNMLNHADYYVRRRQQEVALADAARDATIRALHEELARRYATLADEAGRAAHLTRLRPA